MVVAHSILPLTRALHRLLPLLRTRVLVRKDANNRALMKLAELAELHMAEAESAEPPARCTADESPASSCLNPSRATTTSLSVAR